MEFRGWRTHLASLLIATLSAYFRLRYPLECSTARTLHMITQQIVIIVHCFKFFNAFLVPNESVCIIRTHLHWKILSCNLVTKAPPQHCKNWPWINIQCCFYSLIIHVIYNLNVISNSIQIIFNSHCWNILLPVCFLSLMRFKWKLMKIVFKVDYWLASRHWVIISVIARQIHVGYLTNSQPCDNDSWGRAVSGQNRPCVGSEYGVLPTGHPP